MDYIFEGWDPIIRIFVVGSFSYILLVFLLKAAGKRTLSQMTGFDFIITVAIGSTFGRLITAQGVTLSESAAAFLLLILLQVIFGWMNMKSRWFSKIATSQPTLLFYKGTFLEENIRKCRVNKEEIFGVIRSQGIESLDEVEAVVLETSGGWSVVNKEKKGSGSHGKSTLTPLLEKEEKDRGRLKD